MERVYHKLVRDKIPTIIEDKGEVPIIRILDNTEFQKELENKLLEECKEVVEAKGMERVEELADVLEIIRTLGTIEGNTLEDIIQIANTKAQKRGAFEEKIFLEKVIVGG